MTTNELRSRYLEFFKSKKHQPIHRANLVPQDDATTLFTGSGMQPLIPYLLGQEHPSGTRLVDSQPCFRAEDIDEVGDNRHTTFFEMLGNWSLGDYFKAEQLPWFWQFITEELKLNPKNIYVTVFAGDSKHDLPKDEESAGIWQDLFRKSGIEARAVEDAAAKGMQNGRIFYYDAAKNWWSRSGVPENMPVGEPGGPDSEVFYDFGTAHNDEFGQHCHPNCDCGRFLEIGNSVFMQYLKTEDGFTELPKQNVDFGGGLERLAAAANGDPDIFKIDLIYPVIEKLEELSGFDYKGNSVPMRVIADHLRAATFLAVDGVVPSNNEQGYVMRRFIRRAIRQALVLDLKEDFMDKVVPVITAEYAQHYPEVKQRENEVMDILMREETLFRKTLERGVREFAREIKDKLTGEAMFRLFDTYGFPPELSIEDAGRLNIPVDPNWQSEFDRLMDEQKERSRTATAGVFKGGLADHSEQTTKYHTANHLMYAALRKVLGDHVIQRGSNITTERLRFDFSHPEKVTPEQLKQVEDIVNEQIENDLPVSFTELPTDQAFAEGAVGAFGDKYGEKVKVYTIGSFSKEICGGPHVEHTGVLGKFKIQKEESSSSGVRRIKAALI